jgi:hypothetical protein
MDPTPTPPMAEASDRMVGPMEIARYPLATSQTEAAMATTVSLAEMGACNIKSAEMAAQQAKDNRPRNARITTAVPMAIAAIDSVLP